MLGQYDLKTSLLLAGHRLRDFEFTATESLAVRFFALLAGISLYSRSRHDPMSVASNGVLLSLVMLLASSGLAIGVVGTDDGCLSEPGT